MKLNEVKEQLIALNKRLENLTQASAKRRREEAEAQIAFERAKEKIEIEQRDLYLALARTKGGDPDLWVDPVTGEVSEEWKNRLLQHMIDSDENMKALLETFNEKRDDYFRAQNESANVLEAMSTLKTRARVLHALMVLLSEDWEG